MDKPLSKNLENIDENKTLKFGVHKLLFRENFEKMAFKEMYGI